MKQADHDTYRVSCLPEEGEYVGTCAEFPSLSGLVKTPAAALTGMGRVVADVVADLDASGEPIPQSLVV